MKILNGTIGNRSHVLPACSAVPQPTASPRVLHNLANIYISHVSVSTNIGHLQDIKFTSYWLMIAIYRVFQKELYNFESL
jgi:hypothetical protein